MHDWRLVGRFLTDVELDEHTAPKLLRIGYACITGKGVPMPVEVRIPVPIGRERDAERVAGVLMGLRKKP